MYPLRSQENADEASPAGAFSHSMLYFGPLSRDSPPSSVGEAKRTGNNRRLIQAPLYADRFSALPKCSAPGTGSRSGPEDGGAHSGHSGLLARGGQTRPCAAAVYLLVPGP